MRVRLIRNTVGTGGVLGRGEIKDLPEAEARLLIGMGKAEPALDPLPEPAAPEPVHRDPAPSRIRGGRR